MRVSASLAVAGTIALFASCSSSPPKPTFHPFFAFRVTEQGTTRVRFSAGVFELPARLAEKVIGEPVQSATVARAFTAEEWSELLYPPDRPHVMSAIGEFMTYTHHRGAPAEFALCPDQRGEFAAYRGMSYIKGFARKQESPPVYDPEIEACWEGLLLGLRPSLVEGSRDVDLQIEMANQEIVKPLHLRTETFPGCETPLTYQVPPEVIARQSTATLRIPERGVALLSFPAPMQADAESPEEARVVCITLRPTIESGDEPLSAALPGGR